MLFNRFDSLDLVLEAVFLWITFFLTAVSRLLMADLTASSAIGFSPESIALRAPFNDVRIELIMLWFRLYCFTDLRADFFAGTRYSNN